MLKIRNTYTYYIFRRINTGIMLKIQSIEWVKTELLSSLVVLGRQHNNMWVDNSSVNDSFQISYNS
jgi:hypothetical protein